jgi:hypothetical protein
MFLQTRDFNVPYLYRNVAGTGMPVIAEEEENLLLVNGWFLRSSEMLLSVNRYVQPFKTYWRSHLQGSVSPRRLLGFLDP